MTGKSQSYDIQQMPSHPPKSPPQPPLGNWQSGKYLVTILESHLPARCVQCNAPVEGKPKKKDFYWHHPAIYVSILAGLLIYIILVLVLRKKVRIHYHLCQKHRNKRHTHIAIAWSIALMFPVFLVIGAIVLENGWLILLGVFSLFAGLFYALIFVPVLTPCSINEHVGWFKRAHPEFLASLPIWKGSPK